jgi:hypothetical protein
VQNKEGGLDFSIAEWQVGEEEREERKLTSSNCGQ